jgi:hypothetical protein
MNVAAVPSFLELLIACATAVPNSVSVLENDCSSDVSCGGKSPGQAKTPDEQVVVLGQVLACDATLGYEDIYNVQVLEMNGEKIKNLAHLKELVDKCTDKYMRFSLEYNVRFVSSDLNATFATSPPYSVACMPVADVAAMKYIVVPQEVLILESAAAKASTAEILSNNSIPSAVSADLVK